jgi:hypothetical protein
MGTSALLVLWQKRQESFVSCRRQIGWDDLQYLLPDRSLHFCESVSGFTPEKNNARIVILTKWRLRVAKSPEEWIYA